MQAVISLNSKCSAVFCAQVNAPESHRHIHFSLSHPLPLLASPPPNLAEYLLRPLRSPVYWSSKRPLHISSRIKAADAKREADSNSCIMVSTARITQQGDSERQKARVKSVYLLCLVLFLVRGTQVQQWSRLWRTVGTGRGTRLVACRETGVALLCAEMQF